MSCGLVRRVGFLCFAALVYNSYFFQNSRFYGNYSTSDSHTDTVLSHAFAYSSISWRRKPSRGLWSVKSCRFKSQPISRSCWELQLESKLVAGIKIQGTVAFKSNIRTTIQIWESCVKTCDWLIDWLWLIVWCESTKVCVADMTQNCCGVLLTVAMSICSAVTCLKMKLWNHHLLYLCSIITLYNLLLRPSIMQLYQSDCFLLPIFSKLVLLHLK